MPRLWLNTQQWEYWQLLNMGYILLLSETEKEKKFNDLWEPTLPAPTTEEIYALTFTIIQMVFGSQIVYRLICFFS